MRMSRAVAAGSHADLARRFAAAAEARRARLLASLGELSSRDAPSGDAEALAPTADLLESRLDDLGARVERHESPAGPVVEGALGPIRPVRTALVLCHYDTVWPRGTVATRPFRVAGSTAFGPGVLDMRGGIVVVLSALEIAAEQGALNRSVRVLLTPDEESGSAASRALIERRAGEAEIVLVPEPPLPGGALKTARKGWITYRIEAQGRAAHAGLEPEVGVNAIDEIVDCLVDVRGLAAPALGTTLSCGTIVGGSASNVVAAHAAAELDVRFASGDEETRVRAAAAALRPRREGAALKITELHSRPPLERTMTTAAATDRARELAALLGLELKEGTAGGVSDANLIGAPGLPILDGLGPEGHGAHAEDERVSVDSLVERTALMALLIAAL